MATTGSRPRWSARSRTSSRSLRTDPFFARTSIDIERVATEGGDSYEQRVTPLELFFDLVFVFALTQVTGFLSNHLT